jgi:hypothetical protein
MKDIVRALTALFVVFTVAHASGTWAADVVFARSTDLRMDRYLDAPTIRQVASGVRAELVGIEAGWVQVRVDGQTGWVRASGLFGDAANASALARLETGRSAPGNIVVAAGIRRIPKASKHALIIGVETAAVGAADDIDSARMMAARLGVPEDNIDVVRGRATFEQIGQAIDRLDDRVQPGDQVMVYYSGPGTQVVEGAACVAAWTSGDGKPLSATTLVGRLRPALTVADKVMFVSDTAYSPGTGPARPDITGRGVAATAQSRCVPGSRGVEMPIVDVALTVGVPAQNIVHLQPAAGPLQGAQQPSGGGLFTQTLADCWFGDALDLDRSGSISVAELATCIERRHLGMRAEPASRSVSVTGNAAFSPIVGIATAGAPTAVVGTGTPKAAIDDVYAQRDGRIGVTLSPSASSLRIGRDELDLRISATRAGYVYLVLLGSDGKSFYLLFPNDLDHDNRIAVGETLRLPRPSWRVQSQGPAGRDTVLAIVSESERDITPLAAHKEGPFSTALTDADGRAQLQWLFGRSGRADSDACVDGGRRRNLAAVKVCSDSFGAALLEIVEQ